MTQHLHFDIKALERTFRATLAATASEAAVAVAEGRAEPLFVAAQEAFHEAQVQCAIAGARATNLGVPREQVVAAIGIAIGLMAGSALKGMTQEEGEAMMAWFQQSCGSVLLGANVAGDASSLRFARVHPMQAGHG